MSSTLIKNGYQSTIEVEHFQFEDDFMEDNVRCIPMVARFKLDAAGIKLKLAEWSRFSVEERNQLSVMPCSDEREIIKYGNYLTRLIRLRCCNEPTFFMVDKEAAWANLAKVDASLQAKAMEYNWHVSLSQWRSLTNLQRFALLKLYRPGHENRNFPKAMKEFNLV